MGAAMVTPARISKRRTSATAPAARNAAHPQRSRRRLNRRLHQLGLDVQPPAMTSHATTGSAMVTPARISKRRTSATALAARNAAHSQQPSTYGGEMLQE